MLTLRGAISHAGAASLIFHFPGVRILSLGDTGSIQDLAPLLDSASPELCQLKLAYYQLDGDEPEAVVPVDAEQMGREMDFCEHPSRPPLGCRKADRSAQENLLKLATSS